MKTSWTDIFFERKFKTPCSSKFKEIISRKLAEAIFEYSGINILGDSRIYLSLNEFHFKFEMRGQTAYFEHCLIGIEHETCPRLDWSYTSKSGQLVTPDSEEIDENDFEVKVDFIKMETFLESFYAKPMALPSL
jgi:hypothetical protein